MPRKFPLAVNLRMGARKIWGHKIAPSFVSQPIGYVPIRLQISKICCCAASEENASVHKFH